MATLTKKTAGKKFSSKKIQVLHGAVLKKVPWLIHGFSTRVGGFTSVYGNKSLNLSFTKEDLRVTVEKNRKEFLRAAGAANWPLVALRQIHSDIIHIVESRDPGQLTGDGLVTNVPGIMLAIQTADCLPVILVDKKNKAVGVFHAGWRGTVKRIVEKGLGIMRYEYGSMAEDIAAVIGPGIQKCCYEVGNELKDQFESQFDYGRLLFHEVFTSDPVREKYPMLFMNMRAPGHGDWGPKLHLDLSEANRRQLLAAGVPEGRITLLGLCTSCDTRRFFSHRTEKGMTGRMMAVAGIRS